MQQIDSRWRLRLTGMFALSLAFVILSVVLFGMLYWLTDRYLIHEVDERLLGEVAEFHQIGRAEAQAEITALAQRDVAASRPYGLFDRNHVWLAGNIRDWPGVPERKPYDYSESGHEHQHYFRGIVVPTTSGVYVVVGHATDEIRAFDRTLVRTLGAGVAVSLALAAFLASVMHALSNRRIREIGKSAGEIMSGDLSQRLPASGSSHELGRLVAIVNQMLDEIERLVAEVRGVCAGIAHDLRTPMTHLRAGLERSRRRAGSVDDYARAVDAAIGQADVVLNRFTALLRIAEIEASERRGRFDQVHLDALVRDVAELYEPVAQGRGIELWVEAQAPIPVFGDADLLFGAVENLLDNALKFTPIGGVVGVQARVGGHGGPCVTVADSGPGIAAGERDAVLRPFYRSLGANHAEGHGLGLSLVAAVARVHGATLEILDNRPGCRVELHFEAAA